ncbi:hypothetical protein [Saccharicrinis sp. FJH54]|uniref:hypothetical protein n=1 Tax=Saccharicrinis sp. FJH54 TaxID=3344665 RepID=UPI0035D45098
MKSRIRIFGIPVNQRNVVRWKIYIDRARMYIGYISFIMLGFVFLNSFQNDSIRTYLDQNKLWVYPVIMVLFVVVSLFLGRLDTKLGMRREEMRNQAAENPVTMEILNSLREIREMQKKMLDGQENSAQTTKHK